VTSAQRLEEELRKGIVDLQAEANRLRDESKPAQEIDDHVDRQAGELEERLSEARHQAVRDVHTKVTKDAADKEKAGRNASNQSDAKAYERFDPETRDKMWNATTRDTETRSLHAQADREQRRALVDAAEKVINGHADRLQDGMQDQIAAIRNGQQPNFDFVEEARRWREQQLAEMQQRQAATFDKV